MTHDPLPGSAATRYPWTTTLMLLIIAAIALGVAAMPPHVWLDVVLRVTAYILLGFAVLHMTLWGLAVVFYAISGRGRV